MDAERLKELLTGFKDGQIDLEAVLERLRQLPFEDLGYARVDHHRSLRQGFPEVIFAEGKTPEQVAGIAGRLLDRAANLLIMPSLDAANIAFNLLKAVSNGVAVSPILLGASKPVHIVTPSVTVRGLLNIAALAVVDCERGNAGSMR